MRKLKLLLMGILLLTAGAHAQTKEITGKVITSTGSPIPGATIRVKGSKGGTSAGADGSFRLSVPTNASTLLVSGVGFEQTEISVNNASSISLKESNAALSEVVVTALGVSRAKKSINYSAQTISSDAIASGGKSNLLDDLNGKVAGVQITNAGGQAGAGTTVVIRGYNSLTGNNQPLYVVDGVPIDNTADPSGGYSYTYSVPTANRAIDLNPDDIESVTVLKGGAATALYGIQAANGALIITTKKGKNGKLNIEGGFGFNTAKANKFPEFSQGFMRGSGGIYNTATTNNWGPLAVNNPVFPAGTSLDLTGTGTAVDVSGQKIPYYPDNFKNFFVTGNSTRYNLAVSGGSDKSTFYAAVSRLDQSSIIKNNTYDKTSGIVNLTNQLTPKLRMDIKFNYINTGGLRFDAARMMNALEYYVNTWDIVNFPWKDANGQETWWQPTISSPQWTVHETGEKYRLNRYISALGLDYKLAKGLSIDYKFGVDNYAENRRNVDPIGTLAYSSTNYLGGMHEVRIGNTLLNSDIMVNYDYNINKDFHLHALVGQNVFWRKYDNVDVTGTSFVQPDLFDITNTQTQTIYHNSFHKSTYAVYGDLALSYKDFLFVEGTFRNDWSSTLPRQYNSFHYPSVTAGFVFNDFLRLNWLSYGKLRASYAGTASDAPVNSLETAYTPVTPTVFGNVRFSYPTTVGNPNLRPEHTTQQEVGLDLGFFQRKILLEATYYDKKSTDNIIYAPTSNVTGVTSQLINLGEVKNKGIDATLTFKDLVRTKKFSWTSAFNFSRNVSKVIKVGDDGNDKVILLGGYNSNAEIDAQKGQAFGAIYGYAYERYGVTTDDPNYVKAPILIGADGKPTVSPSKVLLGNINPKFILAWNTSLNYANFNFGFTLEWKHGGNVVNDQNDLLTYAGKSALSQNRFYDAATAGANATKTFSGVDATGKAVSGVPIQLTKAYYTGQFVSVDEHFVEDASWFRLRNIYLGYSVPEKLLKPIHIKGIDITLAGRNMWLHTKYTGIDPEVSSAGSGPNGVVGFDANGVPNTKSWDIAIKIKF